MAATPMAMPSADRPARSLRVRSPTLATRARSEGRSRASRGGAVRGHGRVACGQAWLAGAGDPGRGVALADGRRVGDDVPVEHLDPPGHAGGDVPVVGDDHDGGPGGVAARRAGPGWTAPVALVEVAGRLVGEHDRRAGRRGPGRWRPAGARRRTAGWGGRAGACRQADPSERVERPAAAARPAGPRRRAARRPRCRGRSGARPGRTAGTRSRSGSPAARPAPGRSGRPTSRPVTRTVPVLGRSRVPIRCSRVVLPDPDGPTMATSSPSVTAKLTPRSAVHRRLGLGRSWSPPSSSSTGARCRHGRPRRGSGDRPGWSRRAVVMARAPRRAARRPGRCR